MRTVPLGELVAPAKVRRAGADDKPVLSMTMHAGLVDQSAKFKKRIASADTSGYKLVTRGQLVVGFPIDEGVLDFQEHYDEAIVSPAYGVWELKAPKQTDRRYLSTFLRSPFAMRYYKAKLRGSTARRRSLPAADFLALEVPFPSIDEQRRISGILQTTQDLSARRRDVIELLDALPAALFNESLQQKQTVQLPIGSFAEVRTGSMPSREEPANYGGTIPWVKTGEVHGTIYDTAEHVTERGVASARLRLHPAGSVVVAMYGQGKTRGQSAILGVPATTNQACAVILPNDRFDPHFLQAQLAFRYDDLRRTAEGGNQPNLSLSRIQAFEVALPKIQDQRSLARQLGEIRRRRALVSDAGVLHDELYASLQSRAFSGQL